MRSKAAAAAERKRQELVAQVSALEIHLLQMDETELLRQAVAHRNSRGPRNESGWGGWSTATVGSADEVALQRWAVNYLRRAATGYDRWLDDISHHVGRAEATDCLRERIYEQIAQDYPFLAGECDRQEDDRGL